MGIADYIKTELPFWPNWINYIFLKLNVFGGLCYGRAYMSYGKEINNASPDEKLLAVVNYAIKHVPYYKKKYNGITIKSRKDFEDKIGFIDKDTVMANWDDFISDEIDWSKVQTGTTGGTSGKPLKLVTPNNRYVHSMYFWHKQLKRFGWNYDTVAVIRNHKLPENRKYLINPIMRQFIFDAFRNSDAYYRIVYKTMSRFRVRYIHAYPSAAFSFLKSCHKQGLDTSFIKACFLTSEAITEQQRHLISDVLKINILGSYGHSEKLCLAGTCPESFTYHIEEEYGLLELVGTNGDIISQPSLLGEITGTTYCNKYFPLIRYRTGDYASYTASECSLHPNCSTLNSIEGRWDKSLIYRHDNSTITTTALNLHDNIAERLSGLQYVQNKKGYLTVNIIADENFTDDDFRVLFSHFADAMGGTEYVTIRNVENLIFQPNGKFLPLISTVNS